jgi:hypothetical protein
VEQLQAALTEARTAVDEQIRLLAEEQDRHQAERETLLAQRTVLEEELGSAIEQLAAAASSADERERQLQLAAERLHQLAAELVSWREGLPEEDPEPEPESAPELESELGAETDADEPETESEPVSADESEPVEYSLFVPGPNGYELIPQTGVPPAAGQKVELIRPDQEEPLLYEVVRSGRTLPAGEVCVYLAQV